MNPKIKEFQNILKKKKVDFALFYNLGENYNPHLLYFLGYKGMGVLIIPSSKKSFILVPRMEFERAKQLKIKVLKFIKGKHLSENLNLALKKNKIKSKRIGIDETLTSVYFLKTLKNQRFLASQKSKKISVKLKKKIKSKYVEVSNQAADIRAVKTKKEIILYKKACKLTDQIFQKCIKNFKKFKTEKQVANFLEEEAKKHNCTLSFEPIVASGKRSAQPHFSPESNLLLRGFCTIDFGIRYKNYCTDMTRTIYLGKPSKDEINNYNLLLNAQLKTIGYLKPGISCKKLDTYTRKLLGKKEKYFIHGLGHGVGINIHELPNITAFSKDKLKENMIVTIEPGIYFPNKYGIRIEDDILITKKGSVVLTQTKKELLTINYKP